MSADISNNRKAFHDYHVELQVEAGIELRGTEVKSIRGGLVNLRGSYGRIENGQVFLYDVSIEPYERASHEQHEPKRKRRLLLHKREIKSLFDAVNVHGRTLIPLRLYWKNGKVKVELGVAKGKVTLDKRQTLKNRAESREAERTMVNFNKSRR